MKKALLLVPFLFLAACAQTAPVKEVVPAKKTLGTDHTQHHPEK